jgi:hypothetical protein
MRIFLTIFLCGIGWAAAAAQLVIPTNAPARIVLNDQFEVPQTLSFPSTNITLLTIADHKGSEQIAGWIAPVKQKYGARLDIRGIADLSPVPRLLRGMIRKQFQKAQSYPVMLDWSGDAVNAFTYVPDQVNVLVIDESGKILIRLTGAANDAALQKLYEVIDRALASREALSKP